MRQTKWLINQAGSTVAERAKYILFATADLLIDTGLWELDTNHHPNKTKDEFIANSNNTVFVLFLKSTSYESGHIPEKLMLGYSSSAKNTVPVAFSFAYDSSGRNGLLGLFTSMIPADCDKEFGSTWLCDNFIPTEASLVASSCQMTSNSDYSHYSMAGASTSYTYTYHSQIVTDGHIILFRLYRDTNIGSTWFVGPAITTLAHPTMDTLPTNKMLNMHITISSNSTSSPCEGYAYIWNASDNSGLLYGGVGDSYINKYNMIEFCNAEGTHIQSSNNHGIFYFSLNTLNSTRISNSSITGFNRWTAICIGVHSSDPTTHYVVKGDGLKGYINTNFLRHVNTSLYTVGQTFDDGNFVYIGCGLALGWDPSNGTFND